MPLFEFSARDANGKAIRATRTALSAEDLALQLQKEMLIPIEINKLNKKIVKTTGFQMPKWFQARVSQDELQMFCRQMYTILKAGVPLATAMTRLAETTRDKKLALVLQHILMTLNQGRSLFLALSQFPDVFSDFFVNLVKVGESTGKLDEIFLHLAEYLELETDTKKKIKTALRYPILVIAATLVALLVINAFVIPAFADLFKSLHGTLPLATRILIATSHFIISDWYILLSVVIVGSFAIRNYIKTTSGELRWAEWKLKIPVVGWLIHRMILERFARLYSLVLQAGLTAVDGIELVGSSTNNAFVAKKIKSVGHLVGRGNSIAHSIAQAQLFTPLLVQMITLGEETGSIDTLLRDVAEYYQREINYDLVRLSDAIEPILLSIMGAMVLVLALGVFLPMWDMTKLINKS